MISLYYERTIKNTILSISNTYPVLLVTGPRQVGKTTLLTRLADESRKIVTLDNPTVRALAKTDPALFLQRYAPPVLIDEVQYAPELFDYIKIYVDEHKRCGDFWLTGSQTFHVMKSVTESLAGRVGIAHMLGLSNSEITRHHFSPFITNPEELMERMKTTDPMTLTQIFDRIYKGSMPRLYERDDVDRDNYYESYLETYISRDIRDLTQVADELSFLKFINIVAARTATNVNYETLASETGISAPTAKQWLSILVSSGLVTLIEAYSNNALKRVIKSPRMYFLDTGLCAYLTRWNSAEALERGAMDGQFFESWVVSEIYKSYLNNGKRPPLYFYRDSNKKEIDVIIHQNNTVYPIEIKKGSYPKDAIKNFSVLKPITQEPSEEDVFAGTAHLKTAIGIGAVVCLASDIMPIDKKNWYVPAWLI
ncbi:ATP-binding protein [Anaerolentibacter hominis]|uniref:ATP-binding protein n=1 Tax=Anaerolentibacter hominis TaxID=3079009 RepID=UPI003CCE74EF